MIYTICKRKNNVGAVLIDREIVAGGGTSPLLDTRKNTYPKIYFFVVIEVTIQLLFSRESSIYCSSSLFFCF
ncbi:MAG: hypothetical protein IKV26_06130, partial [Paludibacteraceae bacterium]|nr:hypothetical protein [Paludibacteraceae bacterium]